MDETSPRREYLLNRGAVSSPAGLPSLPYGTQC